MVGRFFSQRFGYAVHALAYMAKKPYGALSTVPELVDWMRSIWPNLSDSYLSNVIQQLARGGILQSHRGIGGGYSLARPAETLTLRDISEILEGVSLERCSLSLGPSCPKQGGCGIQRVLRGVEEQYLKSLHKISIADIADEVKIRMPVQISI